jgi:DNA-binding response OmpR family regulator
LAPRPAHAWAWDKAWDSASAYGVDLDAGLVTRWERPVRLTRTESRLLEILATSGGRLCTSRFLSERLWGTGSEQKDQPLRGHVASLRRKLDDPSVPELLVTEPGIGYRFVVPTCGEGGSYWSWLTAGPVAAARAWATVARA